MNDFAQLFRVLDQTSKADLKIKALAHYFKNANDKDSVWTIALSMGKRPKRMVSTTLLKSWLADFMDMPVWLFEECYRLTGDLAETLALIVPSPEETSNHSLTEWIEVIISLKDREDFIKKEAVFNAWKTLDQDERFVFNKLISGGFRIAVSQVHLIKALSEVSNIDENKLTHRIMGKWDPTTITFDELIMQASPTEDLSMPYQLCKTQELSIEIDKLGDSSDWIAERKWDGIRGQLILRQNEFYMWTKGGELVTAKFPEFESLKGKFENDIVIDGEILPYKEGKVMNYNAIQNRIKRKSVSKKQMLDTPVIMIAFDLLEYDGMSLSNLSLKERREKLEEVVIAISSDKLLFSDSINFNSWDELVMERLKSRSHNSMGIILKHKDSLYQSKKEEVGWLAWHAEPLTITAVLIYVQRGTGQQSKSYGEFTFAVKNSDGLVPFTKAKEGLSEKEIEEISVFVKKNTIERFGPVRSIKPEFVFEIAFDGIAQSSRHKSGIALRNPRIKRWVKDKTVEKINTHRDLLKMLQKYDNANELG